MKFFLVLMVLGWGLFAPVLSSAQTPTNTYVPTITPIATPTSHSQAVLALERNDGKVTKINATDQAGEGDFIASGVGTPNDILQLPGYNILVVENSTVLSEWTTSGAHVRDWGCSSGGPSFGAIVNPYTGNTLVMVGPSDLIRECDSGTGAEVTATWMDLAATCDNPNGAVIGNDGHLYVNCPGNDVVISIHVTDKRVISGTFMQDATHLTNATHLMIGTSAFFTSEALTTIEQFDSDGAWVKTLTTAPSSPRGLGLSNDSTVVVADFSGTNFLKEYNESTGAEIDATWGPSLEGPYNWSYAIVSDTPTPTPVPVGDIIWFE